MSELYTSGQRQVFSASVEGYSCQFEEPPAHACGVFAIQGDKVVNCRVVCGRISVTCNDMAIPEGTKAIWAKIEHPTKSRGFKLSVEMDPSDSSNKATETWFQLYDLSDEGVMDYRQTVVFPFYN